MITYCISFIQYLDIWLNDGLTSEYWPFSKNADYIMLFEIK